MLLACIYPITILIRISTGVLTPNLIQELSAEAISLGLIGSLYFYAYAAFQVPAGFISDSLGLRRTTTLFGFIMGVGIAIFALSQNLMQAYFGSFITGVGAGAFFLLGVRASGGNSVCNDGNDSWLA